MLRAISISLAVVAVSMIAWLIAGWAISHFLFLDRF